MTDERPKAGREQTDESLRTERAKTDEALAEKQAKLEQEADAVIVQAREVADAVLDDARDKADEHLDRSDAPNPARATVEKERAREDLALKAERDAADESLERERHETALALAKLLPLERVKTDRYLLTERVRADDALSNRDDFLGIVSHDLRNLLGGIVLSAGALAKGADGHEQGTQILASTARIQRYAARMNRLIGDLLDVAGIDAGRLSISPVPSDVTAVIHETIEMFSGDAAAKHISLEAAPGGPPATVPFDHDRILQVLANLVSNAIKCTDEGGRVILRAERKGDRVLLSVADTGIGIAAEMHAAVFERFWQARDNDRRGLGLGLYISKSIVEAHGGHMRLESAPGEGSTFSFDLPAG
ncbi:MAG: ATP-binding protein [Acidobacteriota bacterium]|nr:ATP-binding protein [Acidobacteriota bacterium]